MQGTIVQISVSRGGLPKRAVSGGLITPIGIEGDVHAHPGIHGGPDKAILVIASEVVDDLAARGYPVFYGALGENLTTRGIRVRDIRVGDRIRAGGAFLEITGPRGPCSALHIYGESIKDEVYDAAVRALDSASPRWGLSGFYARVLTPGPVGAGDIISVEAALA
ncbi:MAG: MOSC domain-containing protein [Acidobacteriia bacterium]|nr:MOSC domain-containing protein [Terriglobia bacterium]